VVAIDKGFPEFTLPSAVRAKKTSANYEWARERAHSLK